MFYAKFFWKNSHLISKYKLIQNKENTNSNQEQHIHITRHIFITEALISCKAQNMYTICIEINYNIADL